MSPFSPLVTLYWCQKNVTVSGGSGGRDGLLVSVPFGPIYEVPKQAAAELALVCEVLGDLSSMNGVSQFEVITALL